MTRNGIEYDLEKSPYVVTIEGVKFYFSSEWHRLKFTQDYTANRDKISEAFTNRLNVTVTTYNIADIGLYRKIETRGFLIEVEGKKICQPHIKLNGTITTKQI